MVNAHDFPEVYSRLGINLNTLGCIMLDVENPSEQFVLSEMVPLADDDLYTSVVPEERFWIAGDVTSTAHLTLFYGLLDPERESFHEDVDAVLDGWARPTQVYIDHVDFFESTFEDDPYYCMVGKVALSPALAEGNARLSLLPNVKTFPEYAPHVTIAYIKKDPDTLAKWLTWLPLSLNKKALTVKSDLNYGNH